MASDDEVEVGTFIDTSTSGGTVSAMYQKRTYCAERDWGSSWVQTGSHTKGERTGEELRGNGWR